MADSSLVPVVVGGLIAMGGVLGRVLIKPRGVRTKLMSALLLKQRHCCEAAK
jgi:hypothetical protein